MKTLAYHFVEQEIVTETSGFRMCSVHTPYSAVFDGRICLHSNATHIRTQNDGVILYAVYSIFIRLLRRFIFLFKGLLAMIHCSGLTVYREIVAKYYVHDGIKYSFIPPRLHCTSSNFKRVIHSFIIVKYLSDIGNVTIHKSKKK